MNWGVHQYDEYTLEIDKKTEELNYLISNLNIAVKKDNFRRIDELTNKFMDLK